MPETLDGDPQGGGTAGNANSGTSTTPEGQPSTGIAQLQETLNALNQGLTTLTKRVDGLQSKKDTTISSLKAQIDEYEKLKETLGADGAVGQLELQNTLKNMQSQLEALTSSQTQQANGNGQGTAVDAKQVISEFGLDMEDPLVAQMASRPYASEQEVITAIRNHMKSKNSQPAPNQAQMPASQATQQPVTTGEHVQRQNYVNEMLAARGNVGQLKAIKEKYRNLGVPVDSLVIT